MTTDFESRIHLYRECTASPLFPIVIIDEDQPVRLGQTDAYLRYELGTSENYDQPQDYYFAVQGAVEKLKEHAAVISAFTVDDLLGQIVHHMPLPEGLGVVLVEEARSHNHQPLPLP